MGLKKNHRGFHDWLVQRSSAIVISLYSLWILIYCIVHIGDLHSFVFWNNLVSGFFFKAATLVVLITILAHSSIGLWTVVTDYIPRGFLSTLFIMVITALLIIYLLWGFYAIIV